MHLRNFVELSFLLPLAHFVKVFPAVNKATWRLSCPGHFLIKFGSFFVQLRPEEFVFLLQLLLTHSPLGDNVARWLADFVFLDSNGRPFLLPLQPSPSRVWNFFCLPKHPVYSRFQDLYYSTLGFFFHAVSQHSHSTVECSKQLLLLGPGSETPPLPQSLPTDLNVKVRIKPIHQGRLNVKKERVDRGFNELWKELPIFPFPLRIRSWRHILRNGNSSYRCKATEGLECNRILI